MGFVNRIDQNVAKHSTGIQIEKWWWYPFAWMVYVVLQKFSSLYLYQLFEEMLLMQFFWNIQRNADYPWAI